MPGGQELRLFPLCQPSVTNVHWRIDEHTPVDEVRQLRSARIAAFDQDKRASRNRLSIREWRGWLDPHRIIQSADYGVPYER
jgi:hypothetical protein